MINEKRKMKSIFSFMFLAFSILISSITAAEIDPLKMIYSLRKTYENVNDYTAVFIKQERVRGILHWEEKIIFKFKKPFNIYMGWREGPGEGREILYSRGKNDGKMIINPHGLIALIIPVINIEPDNPMVRSKSRHTIKEAGIGMTIKFLIEQLELAEKQGDLKIEFIGEETFKDRVCSKIETVFPEGKSYYAGRILIYIDKEYNLPSQTFVYDWKNKLLEKASYTELKINVGLGESDFDPKNPEYGFK